MTSSEQSEIERILGSYFKELDAALASVPEPRRELLVSEIREHVTDALAQRPPSSPWDVRELLQRVGTPKDIAAAATEFLSLGSLSVEAPDAEEEVPPPTRKSSLGAKHLIGSGAFLLLVMGLSVGLLIAFAAPNSTPGIVRTRIKVVKEAGSAPAVTTTTTPTTSPPAPTTSPSDPTTSPPATTTTTAPVKVSAVTSTGTALPQSAPPVSSAPIPANTITIGAWTGVKPQTIWFSGDSGNVVTNIVWSSWSPSTGVGQGSWNYDNCVPDCAQGTETPYSATITVSNPSSGQFTQLTEAQTGPHGQTYVFTLPDSELNGASSGTAYDQ